MRRSKLNRAANVRQPLVAGALAVAVCAGAAPLAHAEDQPIVGVIDQARLVKIPSGTTTLIIGNPTIADVTLLQSNNLMVLTPKAFGETNFIALNSDGKPLAESTIQVVNGSDALVVQRGMERQSYSCAPRCQPTARLGDDSKYLQSVADEDDKHAKRLGGVSGPAQPGIMSRR